MGVSIIGKMKYWDSYSPPTCPCNSIDLKEVLPCLHQWEKKSSDLRYAEAHTVLYLFGD